MLAAILLASLGHAGQYLARRPRPVTRVTPSASTPHRSSPPAASAPRRSSSPATSAPRHPRQPPAVPAPSPPQASNGLHPLHRRRPRGRMLCLASSAVTAAGDSASRAPPIPDLPCVPPERGWDGATQLSGSRWQHDEQDRAAARQAQHDRVVRQALGWKVGRAGHCSEEERPNCFLILCFRVLCVILKDYSVTLVLSQPRLHFVLH